MMSGIQHYCFCRRQWALIHIEQQWSDNWRTVAGNIVHKRVHGEESIENRPDKFIIRGLHVSSSVLQLAGICDAVEFTRDDNGYEIPGHYGRWVVAPVEYKHGVMREDDADRCQLCAQAYALEEMLSVSIEFGFVYHNESRRREKVLFFEELKKKTKKIADDMRGLFRLGSTPEPVLDKHCDACSLKDVCMPKISGLDVDEYIYRMLEDWS